MIETDVVIIGGGAAGLSAATYLARSAYSCIVLEKDAPGGRMLTLPKIENYPGFAAVSGAELADAFIHAASQLGIETTYGNVMSVSRENDLFITKTDMDSYASKAIIVATGITFVPSIPGEKDFQGKGVSYCATCDGRFFKGKKMAVYGNGDEALQEALYLAPLSTSLLFVCPDDLHGSEKNIAALKASTNVTILQESKLERIKGGLKVSSIIVNGREYETEAIFPLNGPKSASAFLSPLGLETNKGFLKVNIDQETSFPGVYAAGDILDKKLRQVVTAAGEGATAATSCIRYLNALKKK